MDRNRGIILLVGALALACLLLVGETSDTSSLTTSTLTSETIASTTSVSTTSDSFSVADTPSYTTENTAAIDPLLRPSVVRGWGDNTAGQVGNGSMDPAIAYPVPVRYLDHAKSLAASEASSLALLPNGTVAAWGANNTGQLGDRTLIERRTPVFVQDERGGLLRNVRAIAAGGVGSFAILANGDVMGWGINAFGVADPFLTRRPKGEFLTRAVPLPDYKATGLRLNCKAISAGTVHVMLLTDTGHVFTWGYDSHGQMGWENVVFDCDLEVYRPGPRQVPDLDNIIAIAAGAYHSVALRADGTVWTWGWNKEGELGRVTQKPEGSRLVGKVPLPRRARAIAAGARHTVAVLENGEVMAWGNNTEGQLGNGDPQLQTSIAPVPLAGIGHAKAIAAGWHHTVILQADGSVWTTGGNGLGQLGRPWGRTEHTAAPAQADKTQQPLMNITAIAAGSVHTLAIIGYETAWAWGQNDHGQLANDTFDPLASPEPVAVPEVERVIAVAMGHDHGMALDADGHVWTWGDNSFGQMGIGNPNLRESRTPMKILSLENVVAISAGARHSVAALADGTVWAWGDNSTHQLSSPDPNWFVPTATFPILVEGLVRKGARIKALSAGPYFNLALAADGTVWSWGENTSGQLGYETLRRPGQNPQQTIESYDLDPETIESNQRPIPLDLVFALAAGWGHSAVIRGNGQVWTWGNNDFGQLGDGTRNSRTLPAFAQSWIVAVAAGKAHTAALAMDGLSAWGSNLVGQLGDGGSGYDVLTPPDPIVHGKADVIDVAAGAWHTVELKADGTVQGFGWNFWGQLGDGTRVARPWPVVALDVDWITFLAAGNNQTIVAR